MDKLQQAFDKYRADGGRDDSYASFQAGFTASAVSMRERAVKAAQAHADKNAIINAIGSLSDIPE